MIKSRNENLYKFYRVVGYDYLFYTVISFLFLTQTKGLSVGQVMYISAIYSISLAIFQIPASYVVEKLGLKKSLVLGNVFWIISCVIVIFSNKFMNFACSEIISAMGTALKVLTETQILYASLKTSGNRKYFSKIEGSGVASYYFVEAISCVFIGSVFEINNYIPIIMTLAVLTISFVTSLFFEEVEDQSTSRVDLKQFVTDFKSIIKSNRIKSIFIYVLIMSGITGVMKTLQKDTIVSLGVSAMEYSYIFAVLTLCVGVGSKVQYIVERFTKRKNLTYVGYLYTTLLAILGIVLVILRKVNNVALIIAIAILIIHNISQGIYRISIKKYLNNFTTHRIRGKILSIFYICEGIGQAVLLSVCGIITDIGSTNITLILTGTITAFGMYYILRYMSKHLGLDPDKYLKEDIFGIDVSDIKQPESKELKVEEVLKEMKEVQK